MCTIREKIVVCNVHTTGITYIAQPLESSLLTCISGIYTRVKFFLPWIKKIAKDGKCDDKKENMDQTKVNIKQAKTERINDKKENMDKTNVNQSQAKTVRTNQNDKKGRIEKSKNEKQTLNFRSVVKNENIENTKVNQKQTTPKSYRKSKRRRKKKRKKKKGRRGKKTH